MLRKIIEIDEALCDGCGDCVVGCAEGAIRIVDGKARLVREDYCDGFGDCVGVCPTGALRVVERDSAAFDEQAVVANLREEGGEEAVRRYHEAQRRHAAEELSALAPAAGPSALAVSPPPAASGGGCPGMAQRVLRAGMGAGAPPLAAPVAAAGGAAIIPSELAQWPVQLHLVRPGAEFFKGCELVVMNTCGPLASAEIHQRYLRGRAVVVGCPKLDDTRPYAEKLGQILRDPSIPRAIVVVMEVPCCRGLSQIAQQALLMSGREDLALEEHVLALTGELKAARALA